MAHEDLPTVNATFFGGITQFPNVIDYAKYLAETTDDNENTFKMFASQLYGLGHINAYKNKHMRKAILFFWCCDIKRAHHYYADDLGSYLDGAIYLNV